MPGVEQGMQQAGPVRPGRNSDYSMGRFNTSTTNQVLNKLELPETLRPEFKACISGKELKPQLEK